ncbi:MAG: SPOR domain-containing protein [Sphingobacteriales bacterium]|nr:MAG: SPOR domain-containing protein [Sphingobacteriales bacterium]
MKKTVSIYKALSKVTGCCIFFALFTVTAQAQTRGKVEVIKDARVDTLAARWAELNKGKVRSSNWGYRVQIFNGPSRKEAFSTQSKFQQMHPDTRTYISYRDPNFKVHAGDFRSRLEAQKMIEELKPFFRGMFIISGKINTPKPDSQ